MTLLRFTAVALIDVDQSLLRAAVVELNKEFQSGTFSLVPADGEGDGASFAYRADRLTLMGDVAGRKSIGGGKRPLCATFAASDNVVVYELCNFGSQSGASDAVLMQSAIPTIRKLCLFVSRGYLVDVPSI